MIQQHLRQISFWSLCLALLIVVPTWSAFASKGSLVPVEKAVMTPQPLFLNLGKASMIDLPGQVSDILIADSSVVDIQAVRADRLYAVGLSVGDTNIMALDDAGNVIKEIDVHVTYDLQAIQSFVERMFPKEKVKVESIHDQVVLTGRVSTPEQASKITEVVASYVGDLQDIAGTADEIIQNMLEVRGSQQVMLKVKILEASRTVTKELGLRTSFSDSGNDGLNSIVLGPGSALNPINDLTASLNIQGDTQIEGIGVANLIIDALDDEGFVNVLAEPNLTAISGQQAGFLAGGEFPFAAGLDESGNIIIEFREFGVALNFRPVVQSKNRINLNLNAEVSSLDPANEVAGVPGLDVRRTETTVEVPSGASLMIAGLLQSDVAKGLSALPGVKNAPVLGDLLSSRQFQREETELVVIVTPILVEPFRDDNNAEIVDNRVKEYPLADAFARNLNRAFGFFDEELFATNSIYGYVLD